MISSLPGTIQVHFHNLDNPDECARLHNYVIGKETFDYEIWREINLVNIQVNMQERLDQLQRNFPRLQALKAEVLDLQKGLPCGNLH